LTKAILPFRPQPYWSVWLYTPEPPHYKHVYLSIEEAEKVGIRDEDAKEYKIELRKKYGG
jgi:hypothetical protein